jgi:hypothetical protein
MNLSININGLLTGYIVEWERGDSRPNGRISENSAFSRAITATGGLVSF